MDRFFGPEGPVIDFLNKLGQLIILTFLWIVSCIPVFTIGTATTSLYYAVIKSVRREVGYPVREYIRCFKRTFKDGTVFTFIYVAWVLLAYVNLKYIENVPGQTHLFLLYAYAALIILSAGLACYLFPALSRFDVSRGRLIKMSLFMVFNRLPATLVLVAVPAGLVWLVFYRLPVACLLVVPGIWCYASTYLIEPALKRFMAKPADGEKEWYDL